MNAMPSLSRADFQELLAQHQQAIRLVNDLEFHLYSLGEDEASQPVVACRQAAGALIGHLRDLLFRHDQQVLPVLEACIGEASGCDLPVRAAGDGPSAKQPPQQPANDLHCQ